MFRPELMEEVDRELHRAKNKFLDMQTNHDGYAVILEELDELWDEIKKNHPRVYTESMRKEAIQVAAMALRFVDDRCSDKNQLVAEKT